jgi:hypothetical protein
MSYRTNKNREMLFCCSKELQNNAVGDWKSKALSIYSEDTLNTLSSFSK